MDRFKSVTPQDRCPICDKPDYCAVSIDGTVAMCMRVDKGAFSEKDLGHGIAYFHQIGERPKDWQPPPTPRSFDEQHGRERGSVAFLDKVYRAMLAKLDLSTAHFEGLLRRGLNTEQINGLGYRSLPEGLGRAGAVRDLVMRFSEELLTVPGFYLTPKGNIWLAGIEGLLIPVRDVDGKTQGAMIRRDGASGSGKYRWLAASENQRTRGGVGAGSPFHVANRHSDSTTVWMTEGILKADIAAAFLPDNPFVGLGGLTGYKNARFAETLKHLHAREVVLAFDADAEINRNVQRAKRNLCQFLLGCGYNVVTAEWSIDAGKGIDDLLANGGQPELRLFHPAVAVKSLRIRPGQTERAVRAAVGESAGSEAAGERCPTGPDEHGEVGQVHRLRVDIDRRVRHFAEFADGGALLITATQGVGKSMTTFHALEDMSEAGHIRPVFSLPRHNLISDQKRDDWLHIRPRIPLHSSDRKVSTEAAHEQYKQILQRAYIEGEVIPIDEIPILCPEHRRADALGARRWNVVKGHCTTACKIGSDLGVGSCPWHNQFKLTRPVLTVHETLFVPKFCEDIFSNHRVSARQIAVLDEPSPGKFLETVNISIDDLSRAIIHARDVNLVSVLRTIRETLENVKVDASLSQRFIGRCALDKFLETDVGFQKTLNAIEDEEIFEATWVVIDGEILREQGEAWRILTSEGEFIVPKSTCEIEGKTIRVKKFMAEQKGLPIRREMEVKNEDIPLNFVSDLLEQLRRDFKRYAGGSPYNSAIVIDSFSPIPTIRLNLRKELRVPKDVPLIVLDAAGNTELLSRLIGRKMETFSAHPLPENTRIVQTIDGAYGLTSLWNSATGKPKSCLTRLLNKVVRPLIEKHGEQLLIVTWKKVADYLRKLQDENKLSEGVAIEHYGNLEGTNAFESKQAVVLLGTPAASPADIEEMAHGLFIDDIEPISVEQETVWRPYRYRDCDGNGYEAQVRQYADERMEMLARISREEEIVQAAHRIRPILYREKSIYLLTNIPLNELPPTELMTVEDLSKTLPMPPPQSGNKPFTKEAASKVFDLEMGQSGHISLKRLKAACLQTFFNVVIGTPYDHVDKRLIPCGFPADSTLTRWLKEFAESEGLTRTRVIVEHRSPEEGGGATWTHVYHDESFDEAWVREEYRIDLEIFDVDWLWLGEVPYSDDEFTEEGSESYSGRSPPGEDAI